MVINTVVKEFGKEAPVLHHLTALVGTHQYILLWVDLS